MNPIEEKDNRFYVDKSTVPFAGKGLFASRDIKEGEQLEVVGVVVEKGSQADMCTQYADAFKFATTQLASRTLHILPMGFAAMVNHANKKEDQNVEIRYVSKEGKTSCVYHFIKPVAMGEEVLGDYGDEWRGLLEWADSANKLFAHEEEEEWNAFLKRGLYNLDRLRKA